VDYDQSQSRGWFEHLFATDEDRREFPRPENLLGMEKLMSKRRDHMEKMVALLLIAYTIALWLGETLRETIFLKDSRKQKLYSGLFIFLKLKIDLSPPNVLHTCSLALSAFKSCLLPVRSNV
jgi:hypothetical protein